MGKNVGVAHFWVFRCDRLLDAIEQIARNAETRESNKMANMKIAVAPEKLSGDSIELSPLLGKMVGVFVRSRDKKNTKYGEKSMSHVVVFADGMKATDDPLEGIMFQSYFQDLKLGQWYVGLVGKTSSGRNEAWVLKSDKLDKKKLAEFVKILSALDVAENTETLL